MSQQVQGCFCPLQATLRIRNSNFYSVAVSSLSSQVQYMNTVVGSQQLTNVSSIQPLRDKLVLTGRSGSCTLGFQCAVATAAFALSTPSKNGVEE